MENIFTKDYAEFMEETLREMVQLSSTMHPQIQVEIFVW